MPSKLMIKRLVVVAYDAAALLVVCLLLSVGAPKIAYAYVDPSVMTYTIQAVAGVAVALGAVAGVAFRRTRRALFKLLKIDENANKIVEQDLMRIEPDEDNRRKPASSFGLSDSGKPEKRRSAGSKLADASGSSFKLSHRILLSLGAATFFSMTLLFVAPCEIVAGGQNDLVFRLGDVWGLLALATCACALLMTIFMSLFRGKAHTFVLAFVFAISVCCYIQAMFLNGGLPSADGRAVDWWGDHGLMMVISGLAWLVVIAGLLLTAFFNQKVLRMIAGCLSVVLIAVQMVGVISLFFDDSQNHNESGSIAITETGLYDLSEKNNVVVIILDYYDTRTLIDLVDQDPSMLDEMEGFTWYQNSAGVMIPTGFALPYLMSGVTPSPDQDINDYLIGRYTESTFLEDLHDSGYSTGIYTTTFGGSYLTDDQAKDEIFDNIGNAHPLRTMNINGFGVCKMMLKASLYRDMPWVFKPRFRFYTDDVNRESLALAADQSPDDSLYIMDDARYFDRLQRFKLSVNRENDEGAFRMIHLNGGHAPYTINDKGEYVGEGNSSKEMQATGSMLMASTYLRYMKDAGVYDDATIVITADHGDWAASMDLPAETTSPILLVKESHAGFDPIRVSHAPVSHADYFATVLNAMGQDYAKYGEPFDAHVEGENRVRDFYYITHDSNSQVRSLLGYEIIGDVLDYGNWSFTGEVWPCVVANN